MIYKLLLTILYVILLPVGLGRLFQLLLWNGKILPLKRFGESVLNAFASGMLVEFFFFEIVAKIVLRKEQSYDGFVALMKTASLPLLVGALIGIIVTFISFGRHKNAEASIVSETGDNRLALLCAGSYIFVSALFMVPNSLDNTVTNIIVMIKQSAIAVYEPYTEMVMDSIDRHTKLIELFYGVGAEITGISPVLFVEYVMDVALLLFFFGIYKRIEIIILEYFPKLASNKKQLESCFFSICVALMFVGGAPNIAIPQNIWNGSTLFTTCIIPLSFTYGFAAICECTDGNGKKCLYWLAQMILLSPVAALMHDHGFQINVVLILIALVVSLIKRLMDAFSVRKGKSVE